MLALCVSLRPAGAGVGGLDSPRTAAVSENLGGEVMREDRRLPGPAEPIGWQSTATGGLACLGGRLEGQEGSEVKSLRGVGSSIGVWRGRGWGRGVVCMPGGSRCGSWRERSSSQVTERMEERGVVSFASEDGNGFMGEVDSFMRDCSLA